MKYKILYTLFLAIIFFSCGAGDVYKIEIQNSKNFNVSREKLWETALDIMAREVYVINSISEEKFMVQYEYDEIPADIMLKYTTTQGGKYLTAARSVFIEVKGDSEKSTIIVSADYKGIWQGVDYLGRVQSGMQKLYSNGKFELEFFAKVQEELLKVNEN